LVFFLSRSPYLSFSLHLSATTTPYLFLFVLARNSLSCLSLSTPSRK